MAKQNTAHTMKDVAKEAGVSLGTVSKVINGIPVGEEYRKKVEQAIKELDYHLNAYARGLKSNRTNTIAVILPTIAHPYFGLIAHCINSSLQKRGYRMLLCDTDYDNEKEQEMIRMAEQNKVDGIIALTYDPKLEVPSEINSVSIDRYLGANIPCVASDNYAGGRLAAEKLMENGCRKLAFLRVGSSIVIGIDLSVLGGRISLVADYYYKKTVDLHYDKILPYYTGYSSQTQNIGSKSNKGWEFSLNTQNLVGDFKWSTSLNIALNREKVLDLGDDEYFYTNGSGGALGAGFNETGIVKVGEPLGNFYGYVFDGIYQNEAEAKALGLTKDDVGSVKFKDLNGDNKITTEDRTIIGNANPDFIFGIGNDFSYKNFDLSFMFQGTYGNDVYNLLKVTFSELPSNSNNTGNAFAFVKDSWRGEGTSNTQQAFNKGVGPSSSRFVEDGSYIRLKNLTFGYTLPKSVTSKWGISNLRFYLSGQNLFTITGYSGYDPEVSSRTGNYNLGFDGGSYPATRSYTFGLNLTL